MAQLWSHDILVKSFLNNNNNNKTSIRKWTKNKHPTTHVTIKQGSQFCTVSASTVRNKAISFRKIYRLYQDRFSCTGELYRISASKFISDRKKTSVSFSLSPSTGNDHYILDLKSGLWTDFGCCYFISLSLSLSLIKLSLSLSLSQFFKPLKWYLARPRNRFYS